MNWRRGFVRLWVVFLVVWVALTAPSRWGALTWTKDVCLHGPGRWVCHENLFEYLVNPDISPEDLSVSSKNPNLEAARTIFGPPLLVLVAGIAVAWVIRGFQRKATR